MRSVLMSLILFAAGAAQAQSVLICRSVEQGQTRFYEIRTENDRYAVVLDGRNVLWKSNAALKCYPGLGLYCESQDRREVLSMEPSPDRARVRLVTTDRVIGSFNTQDCRNPHLR
ncbi:MAG: hypothetical protein KF802_06205 [Bdellovibrionaceae bacterium]|nr:hypothetical protein [Pseudobdellovibrionaceae bacterium]MBX3032514.1 hypothetical protein [Pseudobdellovibrionaceae bacterium]